MLEKTNMLKHTPIAAALSVPLLLGSVGTLSVEAAEISNMSVTLRDDSSVFWAGGTFPGASTSSLDAFISLGALIPSVSDAQSETVAYNANTSLTGATGRSVAEYDLAGSITPNGGTFNLTAGARAFTEVSVGQAFAARTNAQTRFNGGVSIPEGAATFARIKETIVVGNQFGGTASVSGSIAFLNASGQGINGVDTNAGADWIVGDLGQAVAEVRGFVNTPAFSGWSVVQDGGAVPNVSAQSAAQVTIAVRIGPGAFRDNPLRWDDTISSAASGSGLNNVFGNNSQTFRLAGGQQRLFNDVNTIQWFAGSDEQVASLRSLSIPEGAALTAPASASAPSDGLLFVMDTPGAYFTDIIQVATSTNESFDVWANGQNLGEFNEGESIALEGLFENGVTEFAITGIDQTDSNLSVALAFNNETASFSQYTLTTIPEPSTALSLLSGIAVLTARRRRNPIALDTLTP